MVNLGLIALAFSSGVIAYLNPCSFALIPIYFSFFMGNETTTESKSKLKDTFTGIKNGLSASLGFATVFLGIGILISWIGPKIKSSLPFTLLIVGIIVIILGIFWALDKQIFSLSTYGAKIELPRTSFFLFGMAYALSSLACIFPVFLMLVFSSFGANGFFSGITVFLSFTLGMSTLMIVTSTSIALSKKYIIEKFEKSKKYITRISGIILILAGTYLIIYWLTTYIL